MYLVGCGSDDHRIVRIAGRNRVRNSNRKPLKLAGAVVSMEYSPIAHSDGDVVCHAVSNALFLAIGERDIGYHFPDTEKEYSGMKGDAMLKYVLNLVNKRGYRVNNVTAMITAGEPRISPYINRMRKNIAKMLKVGVDRVGIGATTGEGLSAHGKGKGINAVAQVSLRRFGAHKRL